VRCHELAPGAAAASLSAGRTPRAPGKTQERPAMVTGEDVKPEDARAGGHASAQWMLMRCRHGAPVERCRRRAGLARNEPPKKGQLWKQIGYIGGTISLIS